MGLFEDIYGDKPWHFRLRQWFRVAPYTLVGWRIARAIERLKLRFPRLVNEGEATARVIDDAFGGYPLEEDFETKEDAVRLLQAIWDIVDNWDGSRINVAWSQGRDLPEGGVRTWARAD